MHKSGWWQRALMSEAIAFRRDELPGNANIYFETHLVIPLALCISLDSETLLGVQEIMHRDLSQDPTDKVTMRRGACMLWCARCEREIRARTIGRFQVAIRMVSVTASVAGSNAGNYQLVNGDVCVLCPQCCTHGWVSLVHCTIMQLGGLYAGMLEFCTRFYDCNELVNTRDGILSALEAYTARDLLGDITVADNNNRCCVGCGARHGKLCAKCNCAFVCRLKRCAKYHGVACGVASRAITQTENAFELEFVQSKLIKGYRR